MVAFLFIVSSFFRTLRYAFKDNDFRGLFFFVFLIVVAGTFFYHFSEGWTWLDAFYFSVVTLTTIGYGDISPHTTVGKLFTVCYIFVGLGAFAAFITSLASKQQERQHLKNSRRDA